MGELSHYGVPGMKWGVRKDRFNTSSRREKKAQKQDFKNKFNREVDSARSRLGSSQANYNKSRENLNAASRAGKGQKQAVKAMLKAQNTYLTDRKIAKTMKFGKETTLNALFVHGPVVMGIKDKQRRDVAQLLSEQNRLKQR